METTRYEVTKRRNFTFRGQLFYLTRLGFGLNCAPRIMTVVLKRVFGLEGSIRDETDCYGYTKRGSVTPQSHHLFRLPQK